MNKEKLSEMRYKRVKVRPIAQRFDANGFEIEPNDDVWLIENASREELELRNLHCGQDVSLGTDYIREFMTDHNLYQKSDGFLLLKVQIILHGPAGYVIEPLYDLTF
jgi:hypothetical protein